MGNLNKVQILRNIDLLNKKRNDIKTELEQNFASEMNTLKTTLGEDFYSQD